MKDSRMRNDSEKFVNARPRNRPGQCSLRKFFQDLAGGTMAFARLNFGINEDIGINRLHGLTPVHKINQGIPVKEVNTGQFGSLPASQLQMVRPMGGGL